MAGTILKFRDTDNRADAIKQAADKEGITVSEYIRKIVYDKLDGKCDTPTTKPVSQQPIVTQPS